MSDPLVLRRSSSPGARRRSERGRLPFMTDDDSERTEPARAKRPARRKAPPQRPAVAAEPAPPTTGDGHQTPPPVFHPLAYRGVVAGWPLESRERWGLRANELEDAGLSWRDAETQAFVEIWRERRAAEDQG